MESHENCLDPEISEQIVRFHKSAVCYCQSEVVPNCCKNKCSIIYVHLKKIMVKLRPARVLIQLAGNQAARRSGPSTQTGRSGNTTKEQVNGI
jgi:hypothetical protein